MKSIRTVLIGIIAVATIVIFGGQAYFTTSYFNNFAQSQISSNLIYQAEKEASQLYAPIRDNGNNAASLATLIGSMAKYDEAAAFQYTKQLVVKTEIAAGSAIALEPGIATPDSLFYQAYIYRDKNKNAVVDWSYNGAQYLTKAWYKQGLNATKAFEVSQPYQDETPNKKLWISIVSPIIRDGSRIGVTTSDMLADNLRAYVTKLQVGKLGRGYLVTADGSYIGKDEDAKKDLTAKIIEESDSELANAGTSIMKADKSGIIKLKSSRQFLAYAPVGESGMKLVLSFPEEEITGVLDSVFYTTSTGSVVSILIFIAILSFVINRRIVTPMSLLSCAADEVACGNITTLKIDYTYQDEIGKTVKSFKVMTENLHHMVQQVKKATEHISTTSEELYASSSQSSQAANQIAASAVDLSTSSSVQTTEVDKTMAAVRQIVAAIERIADTTKDISAKSTQTSQSAEMGGSAIQIANHQMAVISQSVSHSAVVVQKLGESSRQIGEIVDVISGIAGQTNLLALNAAIEAARAGEQGRGFAVVAEEVRKLAEQSQEAARKISQIITEIQSETQAVVAVMNQGTQEVSKGAEVITSTGDRFGQIVCEVQELNSRIQEVTTASQELTVLSGTMANSVENVEHTAVKTDDNIHSISAAAEQQSASMQEISATSQTLARMAEELDALVCRFRL